MRFARKMMTEKTQQMWKIMMWLTICFQDLARNLHLRKLNYLNLMKSFCLKWKMTRDLLTLTELLKMLSDIKSTHFLKVKNKWCREFLDFLQQMIFFQFWATWKWTMAHLLMKMERKLNFLRRTIIFVWIIRMPKLEDALWRRITGNMADLVKLTLDFCRHILSIKTF